MGEEGGFTLSEMMVVTMMLTIVLFALYGIFDMSIKVFSFGNSKVEATENARIGLERMSREIRAAYPYDKVSNPSSPLNHVLFASWASRNAPGLPPAAAGDAANVRRSIVFGNDLPSPPSPGEAPAPNWKVGNSEVIEYRLTGPSGACPTTGDRGVCTLQRVTYSDAGAATASPAVESVMPNGLTFTFLRADRTPAAADGSDAKIVSIRLRVRVGDRAEQTLTTDVELKGKGG